RRGQVEGPVARVLDHGEDLDVAAPGRDGALLVAAPEARLTLGRPAVVVEEVGELGEVDLLEREARPVVLVPRPARIPVVAHRGDRLALEELVVAGEPEQLLD